MTTLGKWLFYVNIIHPVVYLSNFLRLDTMKQEALIYFGVCISVALIGRFLEQLRRQMDTVMMCFLSGAIILMGSMEFLTFSHYWVPRMVDGVTIFFGLEWGLYCIAMVLMGVGMFILSLNTTDPVAAPLQNPHRDLSQEIEDELRRIGKK